MMAFKRFDCLLILAMFNYSSKQRKSKLAEKIKNSKKKKTNCKRDIMGEPVQ